jgi:nucleotide-binding universal stress UspA family protein
MPASVDSVIVPLDGSDLAATALPVATRIADRLGASLRIVGVGANGHGKDLRAYLDAEAAELGRRDVDAVLIPAWDAATGINEYAALHPDAVLCMTSHGRGGLRWAMLGSVAESVVAAAPNPVVLVGPRCASDWRAGPGPVLLCHDGGELPDAVVDVAAEWAQRLETDIVLATVIHPLDVEDAERPAALFTDAEARIRAHGVAVTHRIEQRHYPAGVIADVADELHASMIVMAAHERGVVERVLLGSITMGVVNLAACPVLVARRSVCNAGR